MRALSYYGGKTYTAGWIADQLPVTACYAEPYAGMLAVLLQRPPVRIEIVNDLDRNIANWWRVVRDDHERLARCVALTPHSRDHLREANDVLAVGEDDDLKRAWATHICLAQGINSRTSGAASWRRLIKPQGVNPFRTWLGGEFATLARRMRQVQIECVDAVALLRRLSGEREFVIYVDPPYHTAQRCYRHPDVDVAALTDALLEQRGRVAVSGYGGEWDHLGWRRTERAAVAWSDHHRTRRVEHLWLNFPAGGELFSPPRRGSAATARAGSRRPRGSPAPTSTCRRTSTPGCRARARPRRCSSPRGNGA